MQVLVLTVFLSLILAAIFMVMFYNEWHRRGLRSREQEALLPLGEEGRSVSQAAAPPASPAALPADARQSPPPGQS
jgi:hypothetical protein